LHDEQKRKTEEESKNALLERPAIKVVPSLVEKIKKTALNTGIRFNIVDPLGFDNSSIAMLHEIQKEGLSPDEEEFTDIVQTEKTSFGKKQDLSMDALYIMRKPRFFNSVKQGFEWNKYNQAHFDSENPPPKVIQGYKFNIFYPDLADKSTTP
jgi:hypothetical protein